MIIAFGVFQIVGDLLTAIPKTKIYGSAVVIAGFLISSILISLIPAFLTGFIFAK